MHLENPARTNGSTDKQIASQFAEGNGSKALQDKEPHNESDATTDNQVRRSTLRYAKCFFFSAKVT